MATKKFKPTSPGRRFSILIDHPELTRSKPEKKLAKGKASTGGRNSYGRITSRHKGGGHKRRLRDIDFKRNKDGIPATVAAIEYDPNRSANIALLHYADGEKRYILAPEKLEMGTKIESGPNAEIQVGNCLALKSMPTGTVVHNVELRPDQGGQLGRSAGTSIQLVAKDKNMATLRMPSGEVRMTHVECRATVGSVGNSEHQNIQLGKAGRARWKGKRPQTRGTAMNPVDHPHGGGEGSTTSGRHPVTPWGKPTLGYRTRKKEKASNKLIVRGRKRGKKR